MRRLDHVGVLVSSIDEAVRIYERLGFSIGRIERFVDDSGREMRIALVDVGSDVDLELIEAGRLLAEGQEPLHHICFEVPDIERELRSLERAGTRLQDTVPRPGVSAPRIAFL